MARRLVNLVARALLLFGLSVVLVFGFWEHRNFYQVGLYNLLLLGGLVTFLVLMAFRLVLTGELPRGRPHGELVFTLEEGDRILRKAVDLTIRPAEAEALPIAGQVVRARYETGREFGRLLVLDGRRKSLRDVTEDEARLAGFPSAAALLESGASRWKWTPGDLVIVFRIRPLGVRS